MPLKKHNAPLFIQPNDLIRKHEVSLSVTLCLGIRTGRAVNWGEQRRQRHLVIDDAYRYFAALFGYILGRCEVVAAHIQRLVECGELVFPFLARILFLPLCEALNPHLAAYIEATNGV